MLEWERLPEHERVKDRASILAIPRYLKAAGYAVFAPTPSKPPPTET
jgi:hypothetical protein